MVVLACGTDFVARSPLFRELGDAVALHVAAMGPAGVEELLAQPFSRTAPGPSARWWPRRRPARARRSRFGSFTAARSDVAGADV
jgi:hypothetical protein